MFLLKFSSKKFDYPYSLMYHIFPLISVKRNFWRIYDIKFTICVAYLILTHKHNNVSNIQQRQHFADILFNEAMSRIFLTSFPFQNNNSKIRKDFYLSF